MCSLSGVRGDSPRLFERNRRSDRVKSGRLAQLVERLPYKQEVVGSSPATPTDKSWSAALSTAQAVCAPRASKNPSKKAVVTVFRHIRHRDEEGQV